MSEARLIHRALCVQSWIVDGKIRKDVDQAHLIDGPLRCGVTGLLSQLADNDFKWSGLLPTSVTARQHASGVGSPGFFDLGINLVGKVFQHSPCAALPVMGRWKNRAGDRSNRMLIVSDEEFIYEPICLSTGGRMIGSSTSRMATTGQAAS